MRSAADGHAVAMDLTGTTAARAADAAAIEHAMSIVLAARADLDELRATARALADATSWRSRAADAYRRALGEWEHSLVMLDQRIDDAAADVRLVAQRIAADGGADGR